MIYINIVVLALCAAISRRIDGGWLGWSKSAAVALCVTILASASLGYHWTPNVILRFHGYPIYEGYRQLGVILAAFWFLQGGGWSSGQFDKPWSLVVRYSNAPLILAALYGFFPALIVGPLVGLSAALAKKYGGPLITPLDTDTQRPIDGWEAWYEIAGVGFCGGLAFAAAPVLGFW